MDDNDDFDLMYEEAMMLSQDEHERDAQGNENERHRENERNGRRGREDACPEPPPPHHRHDPHQVQQTQGHQDHPMGDVAPSAPVPPASPDRNEADMIMVDPNKTFAEMDLELADRIKTKYQNMGKVQCVYELQKMVNLWKVGRALTPRELISITMSVYGIEDWDVPLGISNDFDVQELILRINTLEREAVNLYHTMRLHSLLGKDESDEDAILDEDEEHALRFMGLEITFELTPHVLHNTLMEIIEKMYYLRRLMMDLFGASMTCDRRYQESVTEEMGDELNKIMHKFGWFDRGDGVQMKPVQNLLIYLLDCAYEQRLMKLEEDQVCNVYNPVMENGMLNRYAYEYQCSLDEWIMVQTDKEHDFTQWQNLTSSGGNIDFCVKYLTGTRDHQMPTLRRNRCLFSFKNGVYDAEKMKFYRYLESGGIDGTVNGIAAKHFKGVVFDPYEEVLDWRAIETPTLDHILEYQDITGEAKDWLYILMGRMIYDINTFDNWQCAMYLKGYGGTGKTTICQLVGEFYENKSVGTLSNNSERKFGLSALLGKYIFKAPEIKADMSLDQGMYGDLWGPCT
jgi:hypothetical protein